MCNVNNALPVMMKRAPCSMLRLCIDNGLDCARPREPPYPGGFGPPGLVSYQDTIADRSMPPRWLRDRMTPLTQYRELPAIDALVRADRYACTLARFAGSDRDKLLDGDATITMRQGEQVELRFRLPQGLRLPDDFAPEVYFAGHRDAVRIMWDPDNRRAYEGHVPDFNVFNGKWSDGGRFVFRLARGADPIYVAVHRPGLIQFFECGPCTSPDFTSGILVIKVPEPASLNILFDPGTKMAGDLPFDGVGLEVLGKDAPGPHILEWCGGMARRSVNNCRWPIWHRGLTEPRSCRERNGAGLSRRLRPLIRGSIAIPGKSSYQPERPARSSSGTRRLTQRSFEAIPPPGSASSIRTGRPPPAAR